MSSTAKSAATAPFAEGSRPRVRWRFGSVGLIVLVWTILQMGGLFRPGLLDDVDSIYIEIAREMLHRHDFVTPTIDGVRFFDKPPLLYWLAAGSMRIFGETDWAARLPLPLLTLALFLAVYGLGNRLFAGAGAGAQSDRAGRYAAIGLATAIGPYLYTRFFIPDILLALWMTLGVHLLLVALERVELERSTLVPMAGFAAVLAANVLTKGLIGLVLPIGFALLYLGATGRMRDLRRLSLPAATGVFLLLALPWHVLAALRNPAIALPPGLGLPERGGWAWFYLYNEHVARFLSRRIPHDYGQTPVWLFWGLAAVWMFPWTAFLPGGIATQVRVLRRGRLASGQAREAAVSLLLWPAVVLGFFTISARQEYYSLPALPALALLAGGLLARAEGALGKARPLGNWTDADSGEAEAAARSARFWSLLLLVPVATVIAVVTAWFALTAPRAAPGTDLASLLASNPDAYNLSLGHVLDLTGRAMGLFRGPLAGVCVAMLVLGPLAWMVRRTGRNVAANWMLAAAATGLLLCVHAGLERFYPILGSKGLALQIVQEQRRQPRAGDVVLIDGELTAGSTLLFYTRQPVLVVNGRVNGLWYGSFWPDAPKIFADDVQLERLWGGPKRLFLLTYHPVARERELGRFGEVREIASEGGKTVLTNR